MMRETGSDGAPCAAITDVSVVSSRSLRAEPHQKAVLAASNECTTTLHNDI